MTSKKVTSNVLGLGSNLGPETKRNLPCHGGRFLFLSTSCRQKVPCFRPPPPDNPKSHDHGHGRLPRPTEAAPMRTIALMNQKGGVGKTTTTVNLGAALAEIGKRVCLIDLDPQAHLTINYGIDPNPDTVSLYDVLLGDNSFLEAVHKIDDHL